MHNKESQEIFVEQEKFEELVKQVYFHCTSKNPKGLYVEEIDLLEFSARLIAVWEEGNR